MKTQLYKYKKESGRWSEANETSFSYKEACGREWDFQFDKPVYDSNGTLWWEWYCNADGTGRWYRQHWSENYEVQQIKAAQVMAARRRK